MADWFTQNAPQNSWFQQNAPDVGPGVPNPLRANPEKYTPQGLKLAPWGVPSSGPHKTFADTFGHDTPAGKAADFLASASKYAPSPESMIGTSFPAAATGAAGAPGFLRRALSVGSGVGTEWAVEKGLRAVGVPPGVARTIASAAGIGVGSKFGHGGAGERTIETTDLGTTSPAAKIPSIPAEGLPAPSKVFLGSSGTIPGEVGATSGPSLAEQFATPTPPNIRPQGIAKEVWEKLPEQGKKQILQKIAAGETKPVVPPGLTAPRVPPPTTLPAPAGAEVPAAPAASEVSAPPAPTRPLHTEADVIDNFSTRRKVDNLTRHFWSKGVPYEELKAMYDRAKSTGNWDAIRQKELEAYASGKALEEAGNYNPLELVPKTKYKPPSGSQAAKEAGYTPQGVEGTWDRLLQRYPRTTPMQLGALPAPQPVAQ